MNTFAIQHTPDSEYAYPLDGRTLRLVLKTARGEKFKEIGVLWNNKYDFCKRRSYARMKKHASDGLYDYYTCELRAADVRFAYIFLLTLPNGKEYYYSEEGVTEEYDFRHAYYTFFQYAYINSADLIKEVPWAKDAIVYQIFVDRFNRGDSGKEDTYITQSWEKVSGPKDFAGGDLKGILEKLDEIQEMGFNTLYLTPIFRSPSNHKYNITDYTKVDPMFGKNEDFYALIEGIHARGMHIILDTVFNHCDESNPLFMDVKEKGKASEFYDWFIVHGERPALGASMPPPEEMTVMPPPEEGGRGVGNGQSCPPQSPTVPAPPWEEPCAPSTQLCNYEIFADCPYMPKWNTNHPKVREYLINIALTYLSWGVDGLRLDVADEVSHALWRELREEVKKKYPETLLIGEVWHENGMYLGGDQFDGVMNYKLQKIFVDHFANGRLTAQEAAEKINSLVMNHRRQTNAMMLNFLDNHDTPRFLRECREDEGRLTEALVALYFCVGIPCVFYGTELPLTGNGDPDCRRTYNWAKNATYASVLRELATLRTRLPQGDFYATTERGTLVLVRENGAERIKAYFGGIPKGDSLFEVGNIRLVKESV